MIYIWSYLNQVIIFNSPFDDFPLRYVFDPTGIRRDDSGPGAQLALPGSVPKVRSLRKFW